MQKETRLAIYALSAGIFLMILAPILLTQFSGYFSFMDTGPIGDTIGGITAPISGLLGAYLVFLALKAQVDANKAIQRQIDGQNIKEKNEKAIVFLSDIIQQTVKIIKEFKFYTNMGATVHSEGKIAFSKYISNYSLSNWGSYDFRPESPDHRNAERIFYLFQYFRKKLEESDLNKEDREYLIFLFESQYYEDVRRIIYRIRERHERKNILHPYFFDKFIEIDKQFIELKEREISS